ncbi:hypothetical protein [Sinorhizobium psoraleae]|uniref:hypothetical protein n=1 Tax=Sinorhizobium psoraleae TaxID=520838 RepID=UPI001AEDC4E9|nr:hypothetical protein [Sinorhizobium psoraleae]
MRLAGAWVGASGLTKLLRTSDIAAAGAALGEEAVAFARQAVLLPRPTAALMSEIGVSASPSAAALLHCGAAMFGLAIGAIPQMLRARLGLRRPAPIWKTVVEACRDDTTGEEAFCAMRRLGRKTMVTWSHWFN